jgi:hypothetical protein
MGPDFSVPIDLDVPESVPRYRAGQDRDRRRLGCEARRGYSMTAWWRGTHFTLTASGPPETFAVVVRPLENRYPVTDAAL